VDNTTPKTALENPPIEVVLGGKAYQFPEPSKRRGTHLMGAGLELMGKYGFDALMDASGEIDVTNVDLKPPGPPDAEAQAAAANVDLEMTGRMIQALYPMVDWLVDALKVPKDERKALENSDLQFQEIAGAFNAVMEVLQRPFVGGIGGSVQTKSAPTPSENGEVTTPSCSDTESPSTT
jgi:hypothetical protein